MYIITNKEDNRIFEIGEQLDYMSNGYPRIIEKNIAFPTEMVNVHEVEEIPENVEREKYCYTEEQGFYENENYVEPIREVSNAELQEQITNLELALAELYEGGTM